MTAPMQLLETNRVRRCKVWKRNKYFVCFFQKEVYFLFLSLSKVGRFSFQDFQLELSPGWLPTGEERHSLLTVGRTLDWSSLGEAEEDEEVFLPVNIFVWKNQSSISLRCRELLFQTWIEPTTESLVLELCLDDNRWTTS